MIEGGTMSDTSESTSVSASEPTEPIAVEPAPAATPFASPPPVLGEPAQSAPAAQQYPAQQYSTPQHPTQPYATQQYPTQPYPSQQYPTQQYSTQQYPTQPAAQPYGATAALPVSPLTPVRPNRRIIVPILAALIGLLLISTVTFGSLWFVTRDHLDSTAQNLKASQAKDADEAKTITKDEATIDGLNKDVTAAKDELAATRQQLAGTKNTLNTANACLRMLDQLGSAVAARDVRKYYATVPKARIACAKANVGI
jgi:hypothetical protein